MWEDLERLLWSTLFWLCAKVSVKMCQVTPTWHKCDFIPFPPEIIKLCISGQIFKSRLQIFKVPLYPSPYQKCKVGISRHSLSSRLQIFKVPLYLFPSKNTKSWHFWKNLHIMTSDFQSSTLPPPSTTPNKKIFSSVCLFKFPFNNAENKAFELCNFRLLTTYLLLFIT